MKNTAHYLGLAALALLGSCKKELDCGCFTPDPGMSIRYVDASGHDWLRVHHYTADSLRIFFVRDGRAEEVYNPNLDNPKGIYISRPADTALTTLQLYPYLQTATSDEAITLLEFPGHRRDTVRCTAVREGKNTGCTQMRYNGLVRWTRASNAPRTFIVRK